MYVAVSTVQTRLWPYQPVAYALLTTPDTLSSVQSGLRNGPKTESRPRHWRAYTTKPPTREMTLEKS